MSAILGWVVATPNGRGGWYIARSTVNPKNSEATKLDPRVVVKPITDEADMALSLDALAAKHMADPPVIETHADLFGGRTAIVDPGPSIKTIFALVDARMKMRIEVQPHAEVDREYLRGKRKPLPEEETL